MPLPIPVQCSRCETVYRNGEKFYQDRSTLEAICIPCHDRQVVEYLEKNGYYETALIFNQTITELKNIIKRHNDRTADKVFRYCDHTFAIFQVVHKHAFEHHAECTKCSLTSGVGLPKELIQSYPNALITHISIKDCNKPECEYCGGNL